MSYSKKQEELDLIKWVDSETKGYDTCGEYSYCSNCNKNEAYPCAYAYEKYYNEYKAAYAAKKSLTKNNNKIAKTLKTTTTKKTTRNTKVATTKKTTTTTKKPTTTKTTAKRTTKTTAKAY